MTDETAAARAAIARAGDDALRAEVAARHAAGETYPMMAAAQMLLDREAGPRTFRFLRNLLRADPPAGAGLKPFRIALLASFSIEFIQDSLVALGLARGLAIEVFQPGFGSFRQALLDPASALYAFGPDAVVLAVEGSDWVPAAYAPDGIEAGAADDVRARVDAEVRGLLAALRTRSTAPLLVHNFASPAYHPLGIADARARDGQAALIASLNAVLADAARDASDMHIVDYAALVNRHGARNWYDDRMRHYARAPIANAMLPELAAEYLKFACAFAGLTKKCLVVDLDNTLWGGVVGEDGVDGLALGPDYPGSAYVEFQRYVLGLARRGVLLAIASKNNPADAEDAFANHRSMVLKSEHFAEREIHWEPKSRSLARISERLSIGLEHIVFVDDNPAECAEVRGALPMVTVVELPAQPERRVRVLEAAAFFDKPMIADEDLRRGEMYRQRAGAEAVRAESGSLEDFYRDLAMHLQVAGVDRGNLARTAELTRKTNQFNVTTRRYSEGEVAQRAADPRWSVATFRVTDRFGDNGIVGVAMAEEAEGALDVDTLLMSCRVIGRTVETAMLAHLCDEARRRGVASVRGRIVPTAKNVPARSLFADHGFVQTGEDADGTTHWRRDLHDGGVAWPAWFRRDA